MLEGAPPIPGPNSSSSDYVGVSGPARVAGSIHNEDKLPRRSPLKKPLVYGVAAAALALAAWATTSVSFSWKPASSEAAPENLPGNAAKDLSIAEAKRRGPAFFCKMRQARQPFSPCLRQKRPRTYMGRRPARVYGP